MSAEHEHEMERRPAGASPRERRFPRHWTLRSKPPRLSEAALRDWINEQLRQDRQEGKRSTRSAFLDECDDYLLEIETRSAPTTRAPGSTATATRGGAGANNVVGGIGVPFLTWTPIGDAFVEQFDPAAFDAQKSKGWATDGATVAGLWMHDRTQPLASVQAKTLGLRTDPKGLHYEMDLPNSAIGDHVAELVRRGDVAGASVGFRSLVDDWEHGPDGIPRVTVRSALLAEQSLVWAPAYKTTTAALRSTPSTPAAPPARMSTADGGQWAREARRTLDARGRRYALEAASARQARIDTLQARGEWATKALPPVRATRR